MLDLQVHVLIRVTGRVDCFGCVCALQTLAQDKVLCVLCVHMFMYYYTVCYFTCIFYAVVRQISILFIDNTDSVFCIKTTTTTFSTITTWGLVVVTVRRTFSACLCACEHDKQWSRINAFNPFNVMMSLENNQ